MKKLLLGGAAGLVLASIVVPASAQLVTYIDIPQRVATYSASANFAAVVTASKDFFTITGSATQVVRVKAVHCSATASTAFSQAIVGIVRSTADSGGTATAATDVPHDSNDVAGTAVVDPYTAAPTVGTPVGVVRTDMLEASLATAGTNGPAIDWKFGTQNDKEIILRGVAQSFSLATNASALAYAPTLACYVEWTESLS